MNAIVWVLHVLISCPPVGFSTEWTIPYDDVLECIDMANRLGNGAYCEGSSDQVTGGGSE